MNDDKNEIIKKMINVEYRPMDFTDRTQLEEYQKFPMAEIAALGIGLSSLLTPFRTITQTVNFGEKLYRMVIPSTATGALRVERDGCTLGNMVGENAKFSGRARFFEIDNNIPTNISTTMPIDPSILFMAAALMSIEKKLGDIQETQRDILEFLEGDKRAELKGNLNFLADVLNNYKYNWNNETYKTNMHIKVEDIKQHAEQNISFYRERIERSISKHGFVVWDKDVKGKLNTIQSDFQDYQLALYLFGFSAFLEVMLLENFSYGYLNSIYRKLEEYSCNYRELYAKSYSQLKNASKSSVESHFLGGLANISGAVGKAVAKVPGINKSQVDGALIDTESRLNQFRTQKTEMTMEQFANKQSECIRPFMENIKTINILYNQPLDLLFDQENLYFKIQ